MPTLNKVTIVINFGNEAMQTEADLVDALHKLANRIERQSLDYVSKIMDLNGNAVGIVTTQ
jgi:hypothetical protein